MKVYRKTYFVRAEPLKKDQEVETLEGIMYGKKGDYLCYGIKGEKWVVKKDIFEETYEEVE